MKLVDRNIRAVTEDEWAWADIVLFSGMIVQKTDLLSQIAEAKQRGKLVAVGTLCYICTRRNRRSRFSRFR